MQVKARRDLRQNGAALVVLKDGPHATFEVCIERPEEDWVSLSRHESLQMAYANWCELLTDLHLKTLRLAIRSGFKAKLKISLGGVKSGKTKQTPLLYLKPNITKDVD